MTGMAKPTTSKPDAPNVPVVDMDRIRSIFAELKKMQVKLDPNPIEYGPKRFNNRIAQVRALLNRVEQIFLQTAEDLHIFKRLINAKRTLYEFDKRELMINDPKCRVGRSQGEREALADIQLRDQLEELATLELAAHDLETVMISIKSKRTDLKDAQGRMRDQLKMIEHDLGMGARWGNNAPPSSAAQSVNEIHSLLDQMDAESGVSDDEDDEDEAEEEETEDEETEEEPVIVEDAHHDPAPHVDPEPVLTFGEEPEEEEAAADDSEELIPTEDAEGSFPETDSEEPDAEVDDFLDSLGALGDDEEEDKTAESAAESEAPGIDDLIASFSDD